MTSRLLTTLAALSILAASAAVHAQTPSYQYRIIPVHNVTPVAVLKAGQWESNKIPLPAGVQKVFALQSRHALVVYATPAGCQRIQAIVSTLDVPALKPPAK